MMLDEVPGALERPGGCRILVHEADNGREASITIPPRPLPWPIAAAMAVLAVNLIGMLCMGTMLFFAHRSIGLMAQIAPHELPVPLRGWTVWLILGWLALLALGVGVLVLVVRPALMQEIIHVGPEDVSRLRQTLGQRDAARLLRRDVRGFHLERDPQRLVASTLCVQGRGEELLVAEHVPEADREWLHSVGNALLRRL